MLFVTPVNKKSHNRDGATTNDYCFISCYFISFKINLNRYNLNVKYWIGYWYRQIHVSVIKNRNIRISVFSHIGASLIKINVHVCVNVIRVG